MRSGAFLERARPRRPRPGGRARGAVEARSRRLWHLVNLPAGSDVARLRRQVAELDRELRRRRRAAARARPLARQDDREGGPRCRRSPQPARLRAPGELLDRVRRDVERNALRARNGIKLAAGVDRPRLGQTPEGPRVVPRPAQLWRYRSRPRDALAAAAHRLQPREPELRARPAAGQLVRRAPAVRGLRRLPARLGAGRRAPRRTSGSRTTPTTYLPEAVRADLRGGRRPSRSTSSATASAACCRCSTPRTIPDAPLRSLTVDGHARSTSRDWGLWREMAREGRLDVDALLDENGNVPPRRDPPGASGCSSRRARSGSTRRCSTTSGTTSTSPPTRP